MPQYTIQAPDGRQITVQANSQDDAVRGVQQWVAANPKAAPPPNSDGALPNLPDFGPVGNALEAGVVHFGHQFYGAGDAVGTAGVMANRAIHGQPVSWQTAHNAYMDTVNAAQAEHPVASMVGGVAGGVDSAAAAGVLLARGLNASPALAAAAARLRAALAIRKGQALANAGRAAVAGAGTGAAMGGAQGASEGVQDSGISGAVQGGASGAVGGALAGAVAGPVTGRLARTFAPLNNKVARTLGRLFNTSADDASAAADQFRAVTGQTPSMAEMANLSELGLIRGAANDSSRISNALLERSQQAAIDRQTSMQDRVADLGPAVSSGELYNQRDTAADQEFGELRAQHFDLSPDDADYFKGTIIPATALSRLAKQNIAQELEKGYLTGNSVALLRRQLGQQAMARPGEGFKELQSDLDDLFSDPNRHGAAADAYNGALQGYAARSSVAEGAKLGEGVVSTSDTPNFVAEAKTVSPTQAIGVPQGARSAIATATQTPQGATGLAQRLAYDQGLHERLTATIGQDQADALRTVGLAHTAAAQNLDAAAPGAPRPPPNEEDQAVRTLVHAGAAALQAGHGSPWSIYHIGQVVSGLGMSDAVQEKVASYLTDPKMTNQGINLLRKAGASDGQIRDLALKIAGGSGLLAGTAVSGAVLGPHDNSSLTPQTDATQVQSP